MGTKTTLKTGVTVVLLTIIAILPAFPQVVNAVTRQWVQRYDGLGKWDDYANAIAVDYDGNVFITGGSANKAWEMDNFDYVTIKYNSDGVQQWVQKYDGTGKSYDEASAITVDTNGNIFITGSSTNAAGNFDFATIKYNSAGERQWVQRYNGPGNGSEQVNAIAMDTEGNIYITGSAVNKELAMGYATIKYDTNGKRQWVRRYDGPAKVQQGLGFNEATAIAVDTNGNVFITGSNMNVSQNYDYATIKYNSDGVRQWVRRYDGTGKSDDVATGIAVDAIGDIYVTGYSRSENGDFDYTTIKYNSNGKQPWVQRYNGPGNNQDFASAIAMDTEGNVYVFGDSSNTPNSTTEYATIKYDSTGKQQWVRKYGAQIGPHVAIAMALDTEGNVYVTGDGGKGFNSYGDYTTIKYNTDGVRQWIQRYNGPGNQNDVVHAIAVDTSGNAYLTGSSTNKAGNMDYTTIKYAP